MAKSVFTSDYESFLVLLVKARKSACLTQMQLAEKLKRPQSFVSKYERGERRLDVIEFIAIAHAIGIDPADIVKRLDGTSIKKGVRVL